MRVLYEISLRERDQQFEQFCSMFPERTLTENAVQFAYLQECCSGLEEGVYVGGYAVLLCRVPLLKLYSYG